MRAGFGALGLVWLALGCNSLAGLDDLEKVDCVKDCAGAGGAAGTTPETVWVGRKTSCTVLVDKSVWCWGANPGVLPGTVSTKPVLVSGLSDINSISVGQEHACAIDGSGTVWCWGRNDYGQLGDGSNAPSPEPKAVPGLPVLDTVVVGSTHSCAYTSPDTDPVQLFCWGQNDYGQLGDGSTNDQMNPVKVTLPGGAKAVRVGPGTGYTAAIVSVGGVLEAWCWGRNDKGQCGQPTAQGTVPFATKIPGLPQLERVYPGHQHVCGRTVGEKIPWCWGANDNGQIGINTSSASELPVQVLGAQTIDTMYIGARHSCLITQSASEGVCWGANDFGQFGGQPSLDQPLPGPAPILDKAAGSMRQAEHGCRILEGVIACFGANDSGQLGNGKIEPFSAPVQVDLVP
ncbi:MAG: hypothetical protein IPI67_34955 [Myxococcales bacterium]|nr:hypothetical protein [Myxococcales bacterium]